MAEKEAESEAETVVTGWSVSTFRVLIPFYNENPLLWDKNHKEYGKKNIIIKTLKPLLAKLGKSRAPHTKEAVKKRWPGLRSTTIRNLKNGQSRTACGYLGFKNRFILSVRISSYGCTREVRRARKKR